MQDLCLQLQCQHWQDRQRTRTGVYMSHCCTVHCFQLVHCGHKRYIRNGHLLEQVLNKPDLLWQDDKYSMASGAQRICASWCALDDLWMQRERQYSLFGFGGSLMDWTAIRLFMFDVALQ